MITQTWTYPYCPNLNEKIDWETILSKYDCLQILETIPQSPIYHGEGNVWIHTKMVCEEMIQLTEWQALNELDRSILFFAALLHDIGKAPCTVINKGQITSHKHAVVGALMVRQLLMQEAWHQIPFELRERVVYLVRYHGLPLWFTGKRNPEKEILRAAQLINLKHLAILAEADLRGRICEGKEDLFFNIELFKETAEKYDCLEQAYPFFSDAARFIYFQKEDGNRFYEPYEKDTFEVILMAGLPGAGKDTYLQNNLKDLPIISLDKIRKELKISPKATQGKVIQTAKERAKVFLRKKEPFVWNATNISRKVRGPLVELFSTYGATVKIIYIEPNLKTLFAQNENREDIVPRNVLKRMMKRLELPTVMEAHQVEYVIKS